MNKSESIANLALALSKAQGELSNPKKTSANPFFKSKYADLSEVINVSKSILSEHGLSVVQLASFADGQAKVETIILHSTGEYLSETLSLPVAKQDAQSIGLVITYARRYSWAAICGLAQEDDDANSAVGNRTIPAKPVDYTALLKTAKSRVDFVNAYKLIPANQRDELAGLIQEVGAKFPKQSQDQEAVA